MFFIALAFWNTKSQTLHTALTVVQAVLSVVFTSQS